MIKNVGITLEYVSMDIFIFHNVEMPLYTEYKLLTTRRMNK